MKEGICQNQGGKVEGGGGKGKAEGEGGRGDLSKTLENRILLPCVSTSVAH